MGRLTQKEASGRWRVKGLPWEMLQEGSVITEKAGQILYGCLCKLKDYEDSGINPEQFERLGYELEDMAVHVCNNLCRHPREVTDQAEMDAICKGCWINVCLDRIFAAGPLEDGEKEGKVAPVQQAKLAEYETLEEQGRLLKLPCAVGDTVYTLNKLRSGKIIIAETTADAFLCALCMLDERFGKTVFSTYEEAEKALKGMVDMNG